MPVYTEVFEPASFLMGIPAAQSISESDALVRGLTNHLQLLRTPSQEAVGTEGPGPVKLSQKHGTGCFYEVGLTSYSCDVGSQVKEGCIEHRDILAHKIASNDMALGFRSVSASRGNVHRCKTWDGGQSGGPKRRAKAAGRRWDAGLGHTLPILFLSS